MKKAKNIWINGFFRAWDMLYYFPVDSFFSRFLKIEKENCRGIHTLCGMLGAAFFTGLLLAWANGILSWLIGSVAGAIVGALATLFYLVCSDHGTGLTLVSNMLSGKMQGKKFKDTFANPNADPEMVSGGISAAVFAVLIIFKLVILYLIMISGNLYLLILIILSGVFVQAFAINAHTGSEAFFGFANDRERNIFYITAIILLLLAAKFNIIIALAFAGGNIIWALIIKERLLRIAGGKSNESITLYGECSVILSSLIALIYSAGALQG